MTDHTTQLQQSVRDAIAAHQPLQILGGGSKSFLCPATTAHPLSVRQHQGIINYQPTELVLTARAGTPLREIETALSDAGQTLPFEPPHFSQNATFGGAIASGLSGPIRPFTGSARDFVLGCKIINGKGEILTFGGQVMKNVAGYDVSRLMVGAMGTLGILLEISIKVLPAPPAKICLCQTRSPDDALRFIRTLASQNLPLNGLAFDGENVHLRLAGATASVNAASRKLGGEQLPEERFWQPLKEQTLSFFSGDQALWRISVPPASPLDALAGKQIIDWAGGLRWLKTDDAPERLFKLAEKHGGHAWLFRSNKNQSQRRQSLSDAMMSIHQQLKRSFDPHGILNPGTLYPGV